MLLEHEVKNLLCKLGHSEVASIDLGASRITLKTFKEGREIFLSTLVYFGGNYIPKSVRGCLEKQAPFCSFSIQTTLKVDEENFKIFLNYVCDFTEMNSKHFIDVLEEFHELAERWREYLDEHDKNDLVCIPVR